MHEVGLRDERIKQLENEIGTLQQQVKMVRNKKAKSSLTVPVVDHLEKAHSFLKFILWPLHSPYFHFSAPPFNVSNCLSPAKKYVRLMVVVNQVEH